MKRNKLFLKQQPLNSLYSQPHNADTHPPTKPPDTHSLPPNLLQTVPHAAHKMHRNFKMNGVTSIDLKFEKF